MGEYDPQNALRVLEQIPGLSAAQARHMKAEVQRVNNGLVSQVMQQHDSDRQALYTAQKELDARLETLRGDYKTLVAEGKKGRMTAQEFQERFEALAKEQAAAEDHLESLRSRDERLREIASDPLGYYCSLLAKFPALRRPQYPSLP
ncbi:MAG TPA: hypothetical protein VFU43_18700 [Streptosporangiaceae bacterium]|nr:hypothetical protein [Streptosporangiaceae bacterium]